MEPDDSRGRRGRLRASQADREHVIETLKVAFVQGRLTSDELDARVGQTLAARTYAELAALTDDLPAGLSGLPGLLDERHAVFIDDVPVVLSGSVPARQSPQPARRPGKPMSNAAKAGLSVTVAVAVLVVLTALTGGVGFVMCVAFYFMALLVAGAQFLYSQQQRAPGQLPPGPLPGDRALDEGPAVPPLTADQPASQDPGSRPDQTRTDLRTRRAARRRPVVPLAAGLAASPATGSCG